MSPMDLCTSGSCRHFHCGDCLVIPWACSLWGRTLFQNSHILSLAGTVAAPSVAELHFGWLVGHSVQHLQSPPAPPQYPGHPQSGKRKPLSMQRHREERTIKSSLCPPGSRQKPQGVCITGRRLRLIGGSEAKPESTGRPSFQPSPQTFGN